MCNTHYVLMILKWFVLWGSGFEYRKQKCEIFKHQSHAVEKYKKYLHSNMRPDIGNMFV